MRSWSRGNAELADRATALLHWNGDRPQLAGALNVVARALLHDDPSAAAALQGAARQLAPVVTATPQVVADAPPAPSSGTGPGLIVELRRETTRMLDDALGSERRRALRGEGEAMDQDHAVAYALEAIERARARLR